MNPRRRAILAGGLWLPAAALAQHQGAHHGPLYEQLRQPGRIDKPELAAIQNVFDSPAPKAANPGRWTARAPLPLPGSEMAWATAHAGRMHIVGGYGEQRVDRPYNHVYDAAADRWTNAAPLPRGANHVGVARSATPPKPRNRSTGISPTTRRAIAGRRARRCRRRGTGSGPQRSETRSTSPAAAR